MQLDDLMSADLLSSFQSSPDSRLPTTYNESFQTSPEKITPPASSRSFLAKLALRQKDLGGSLRLSLPTNSPVKRKNITAVRARSRVSLEAVTPQDSPRGHQTRHLNFSLTHAKSILARTESLKVDRSPSRTARLEAKIKETNVKKQRLDRMYNDLKAKNIRLKTSLSYALFQQASEMPAAKVSLGDLREVALQLADEVAGLKVKFSRL